MKDLEVLKEKLNQELKEKEFWVDEIYMEKKGKYHFLVVVVDNIGGIDLDGIVEATNIINPIVDKYDICDESFILDVISKERGN